MKLNVMEDVLVAGENDNAALSGAIILATFFCEC